MLPVILGGAALLGYYAYQKKKQSHPAVAASDVANTMTGAPPPPKPGQEYAGPQLPANNSLGAISYHPTVIVPGFNTPLKYVAVPPAPSGTAYPPASTVTDPAGMVARINSWQAATPTPSAMYYYPADPAVNPDKHADIWSIVAARLGGTPKARLLDPKGTASTIPLSAVHVDDLGKLNGIVSFKDWDIALQNRKPIMLPLGGYNDIAGPVPFAMGTIGPKR